MAIQLPIYERQVRATQLQAPQTPVVNASNAAGLNALGQGIERLGAGVAHAQAAANREAMKADALRLDVAKSQITQYSQHLLEGQENGFITTQTGESAIKNGSGYKTQLEGFAKTIAGNLSPAQQEAIKPAIISEMTAFSHAIDLHVSKQTKQLQQDTDTAILSTKANQAASAAVRGDIAGLDDALGAGHGQIDKMAELNHWPPEIKEAKLQEYTSGTRIGVLETLLGTGQTGLASQYLHEWGATLNQDDVNKSRLRERVDGAVVSSQAGDIATSAWARSKSDAQAAEEAVSNDATLDPKVRELAIANVRKMGNIYTADMKKADSGRLARIIDTVTRQRGGFSLAELDAHPDMVAMRGDEGRANAVRAVIAEQRRNSPDARIRGVQSKTDRAAVEDAKADALNDPQAFVQVDIASKYPGISDIAGSQIRGLVGKTRTSLEKGDAVSTTDLFKVLNSQIDKNTPRDQARQARGRVADFIIQWKADHEGKNPPSAESQRVLAEAINEAKKKKPGLIDRVTQWASGSEEAPAPRPAPPSAPRSPKADLVWIRNPATGAMYSVPGSDKATIDRMVSKGGKIVQGAAK